VRSCIDSKLKRIGFRFVTVDLKGFRSGSLNEGIGRERPLSS
jgi:PP-loop superfamily ATP-utilizing enzyme